MSPDLPDLSVSLSTASSSSASSLSSIPTRRIRFAPLPDPRALDIDDVDDDDDDNNNNLHNDNPAATTTKDRLCLEPCLPDSKQHTCLPSPIFSKPTTHQLLSHPPVHHTPSWSKPKSLNLLRPFPFKRASPSSSSHSLTPTPSLDSNASSTPTNSTATEILTLGTINLFRPSSKNNSTKSDSSSSNWGFGLTRWSSAGSYSTKSSPLNNASTTSLSKLKPGSRSKSNSTSSTTSNSSTSSSTLPRIGTRMLNGRVYGAKNRHRDPNANPFANVRDEDPEFVEWGYGGMGSVRGGRHAGVIGHEDGGKERPKWELLQGVAGMGAGATKKDAVNIAEEEDDGSGMGWVKKRREQREKERREREQAEKEKEKENVKASEVDASPETTTPMPNPQPTPPVPASTSTLDTPTPSAPPTTPTPIPEHHPIAVTLPAHHSRRRMQNRSTSSDITSHTASALPVVGPASPPLLRTGEMSGSGSESESEESETEGGVKDDDDDDDDEDDDEEAEEARRTARGAGVEKISRHN